MNRTVAVLSGMSVGAGVVYMLDPQFGNRRRALLRDKVTRAAHKTGDAIDTTSRDLAHRAQGVMAETRGRFRRGSVDDDVLVARVRAKLGRVVSHPHSVRIDAHDGRVTLSGPILESEVDDLLDCVRRVRGVVGVESQLEAHKTAGDVPGLQGGAPRPGERFELMQENWSATARVLVGGAGGALITWAALRRCDAMGTMFGVAGVALIARAATNLETKRIVGIGAGRRAVDLQKTISIDAPVDQVWEFWNSYENFPRFMHHVREVRSTGVHGQSHWRIEGPGGVPIEYDAVVTEQIPNKVLAWKTVEGSPVEHAGYVHFEPTVDGRTRLHIRMSYNPPGGAIGHGIAWLFGADAKSRMDADLVRMKTLIETGHPPHDAAQPPPPASEMLH